MLRKIPRKLLGSRRVKQRGGKVAMNWFWAVPLRGCSPPRSGSAPLSCGPFWNHHRGANVCFSCFLACLDSVLWLCSPTCFSPWLLAVLWRLWLMAQGLLGDRSCVSPCTGAAPRALCASQPPSANTGTPALPPVLSVFYMSWEIGGLFLSKRSSRAIGR